MTGTLSQRDLDFPSLEAIWVAASDFITRNRERIEIISRSGDCSIPYELFFDGLVGMVRSGEISEALVEDVQDDLDLMYEMDLCTPVTLNMFPEFLAVQRSRAVINHANRMGSVDLSELETRMDGIRDLRHSFMASEEVETNASESSALFLPTQGEPLIPMGIDSVDSRLGGGMKRRKVCMICAYTGFGKTTLGLNICWRNSEGRGPVYSESGLRTAFVTTELPKDECMCRYYSMMLEYSYELIWKGDPSGVRTRDEINAEVSRMLDDRTQSDPLVTRSRQNFNVWDFSTSTLTPSRLESHLRASRDAGTPIDVVCVDYIDKMELSDNVDPVYRADTRSKQGFISRELERLAIEYNCLMIVLTQANDDGLKRPTVGLNASRDARNKNDPVSYWMGLGGTSTGRENGIYHLNVPKNRDGRTFGLNISGRLDVQRFTDYTEESQISETYGSQARRQQVNS